jgi:hypothetical protein
MDIHTYVRIELLVYHQYNYFDYETYEKIGKVPEEKRVKMFTQSKCSRRIMELKEQSEVFHFIDHDIVGVIDHDSEVI